MSNIRIVLFEAAEVRNLGAVTRLMKNFGLSELWLVSPKCDHFSDEAQHMAVHAPRSSSSATA
jgi:tRNA/rRNA methyltransferase